MIADDVPSCSAGICVGKNPVTCTAQDQCHVVGVCDPGTGVCSNPAQNDGSSCTDGNGCTQGDTCQAGACASGAPVVCTAADQCHSAGVCNPSTGQCNNPNKVNGTPCNDADACSHGDSCYAGVCTPVSRTTCAPGDQCHTDGVCNPTTGLCANAAKPDGTTCNDGNACTQADTCQAGSCTPGTPLTCSVDDPCKVGGSCDPATGQCSVTTAPDGSTCDDGDPCTMGDTCQVGVCHGGSPADQDGDGVCDARDVCPTVFDPAQSDRNHDGTDKMDEDVKTRGSYGVFALTAVRMAVKSVALSVVNCVSWIAPPDALTALANSSATPCP